MLFYNSLFAINDEETLLSLVHLLTIQVENSGLLSIGSNVAYIIYNKV